MPQDRSRSLLRSALLRFVPFLAALAVPALAQAQTCIGSPNLPGQFSIGGYVGSQDAGTSYGVSSQANLDSPYGFGARLGGLSLDGADITQTVAAASGLMEFPFPAFTACPVVEVEWGSWSEGGATADFWSFPLGISAGMMTNLTPNVDLLPSGRTGLVHRRASGSAFPDDPSDTNFFLEAGATFSFTPYFVRGELGLESGDGSDTSFRLSGGVRF